MIPRIAIKAAMRSAELGHLAEEIQRLEQGGIDALHFDVMDGRFIAEICMGASFIRGLRRYTSLPFEVHLLIQQPDAAIAPYVDAGADCILIHIEASPEPLATLQGIRAQGRRSGLAIAPATPAHTLAPYLAACDVVNVMTVAPGLPGALQEGGVRNLAAVAALLQGQAAAPLVQADGAVSAATRQQLLEAGAQALVAGYPIFSRPDRAAAIAELRGGVRPMATART